MTVTVEDVLNLIDEEIEYETKGHAYLLDKWKDYEAQISKTNSVILRISDIRSKILELQEQSNAN